MKNKMVSVLLASIAFFCVHLFLFSDMKQVRWSYYPLLFFLLRCFILFPVLDRQTVGELGA